MAVLLVFEASHLILEQVCKVRVVNMVTSKISGLTESALKTSLHSAVGVFGETRGAAMEKQLTELLMKPDDIKEIKQTLHKVVEQVNSLLQAYKLILPQKQK